MPSRTSTVVWLLRSHLSKPVPRTHSMIVEIVGDDVRSLISLSDDQNRDSSRRLLRYGECALGV